MDKIYTSHMMYFIKRQKLEGVIVNHFNTSWASFVISYLLDHILVIYKVCGVIPLGRDHAISVTIPLEYINYIMILDVWNMYKLIYGLLLSLSEITLVWVCFFFFFFLFPPFFLENKYTLHSCTRLSTVLTRMHPCLTFCNDPLWW